MGGKVEGFCIMIMRNLYLYICHPLNCVCITLPDRCCGAPGLHV